MYKRYRQEWTKHLDFIVIEEISLQLAYLAALWFRFGRIPSEGMYKELGVVLFLIDFVVVMSLNTMHNVLKRGFFMVVFPAPSYRWFLMVPKIVPKLPPLESDAPVRAKAIRVRKTRSRFCSRVHTR